MTSCCHLRVASEALRLVLIDADSYRLQQAMKKAQTFGTFLFFFGVGGTFRMVLGGIVLGCPAGTGCKWMSFHPFISRLVTSPK